MSCETCKNREAEAIDGATKESRLMSDMVQAYARQNRRLWVAVLALAGTLVITAGAWFGLLLTLRELLTKQF